MYCLNYLTHKLRGTDPSTDSKNTRALLLTSDLVTSHTLFSTLQFEGILKNSTPLQRTVYFGTQTLLIGDMLLLVLKLLKEDRGSN